MQFALTFVLALLFNLALTPLAIRLARRNNWLDQGGGRKIHQGAVPRIGGTGIALSFALAVGITLALSPALQSRIVTPIGAMALVTTGFLVVHAMGLADDFLNLRARFKLIFQMLVAAAVLVAGYRFRGMYLPFGDAQVDFGFVSWPITFLWIVGMMNAMNLIDGLDGLAGGLGSMIFGTFVFLAFKNDDPTAGTIAAGFAGACVGFLFYNFPKARIFMGDSGSLLLGAGVAVLPLLLLQPGRLGNGLLPSVTLLLVPILDTLSAILRRLRRGQPFMSPDRGHVHHKLLDLGFGVRGSLAILYSLQLLLSAAVVISVYLGREGAFWIQLGASLIVGLAFIIISLLKRAHAPSGSRS